MKGILLADATDGITDVINTGDITEATSPLSDYDGLGADDNLGGIETLSDIETSDQNTSTDM